MRNIFLQILDYKEIHPIRFLFWIFLLILFFLFLYLLFVGIIRKRKSERKNKIINSETINGKNKEVQLINIDNNKGKSNSFFFVRNKTLLIIIFIHIGLAIGVAGTILIYRNSEIEILNIKENTSISSSKYIFGIDISHYQGKINWKEMRTSHHPIEFVFIRATMGHNGKDKQFNRNWKNAKKYNYIRGAYHYYRPNENSTKQFNKFSSVVKIEDGDFIPILDIEKESMYGKKKLREGVLNWLKLAEQEYGVKPMIYTGLTFYLHNLKGFVDDYPLWIAAYLGKPRLKNVDWSFHQFTENVRVKGIRTTVDGNDFKGELIDIKKMCK